jgi:hypothetical protein
MRSVGARPRGTTRARAARAVRVRRVAARREQRELNRPPGGLRQSIEDHGGSLAANDAHRLQPDLLVVVLE